MDLKPFIRQIQHSECVEGLIESADSFAILVDDNDGIANELKCYPNTHNRCDYLSFEGVCYQLIELSDLKKVGYECIKSVRQKIEIQLDEYCARQQDTTLSREKIENTKNFRKIKREIQKNEWQVVVNEFIHKLSGSIAITERFLRVTKSDINPEYKLLIVVKNNTEVRLMEQIRLRLVRSLEGRLRQGNVICIKTSDIPNFLLRDFKDEYLEMQR